MNDILPPNMKTFTFGEFVDAIEKNGYPQGFGWLFKDENDRAIYTDGKFSLKEGRKIGSACAIGQGAINLGVNNILSDDYDIEKALEFIADRNDGYRWSIPHIIKNVRERYSNLLDKPCYGPVWDFSDNLPAKE